MVCHVQIEPCKLSFVYFPKKSHIKFIAVSKQPRFEAQVSQIGTLELGHGKARFVYLLVVLERELRLRKLW